MEEAAVHDGGNEVECALQISNAREYLRRDMSTKATAATRNCGVLMLLEAKRPILRDLFSIVDNLCDECSNEA